MRLNEDLDIARQAVICVGGGRGFVVDTTPRFVVTAAHCLPHLPPLTLVAYLHEKIYRDLLGPLGGESTVWAECPFADPVNDIAILCQPDNQELPEHGDAYDDLTDRAAALRIREPETKMHAWLLGLDNVWGECVVQRFGGPPWSSLVIMKAEQEIVVGMSGSPIVDGKGNAIGVLSSTIGSEVREQVGGPGPCLVDSLPGWFLREFGFLKRPSR